MQLIDQLMKGKRVINIDETNLSSAESLRHGWGLKGRVNRPVKRTLSQSLKLTAAIDNLGCSYFSVSQATNDGRIFSTFLYRLVMTLDSEDPEWRNSSVLVLDGASIHRSEETCRAMAALKIPVMIAGPYGFDGSPCEKLFAQLKVGNLNPDCIKTGKR